MSRELLPVRRASETFLMSWDGYRSSYAVTVGFYPDGRVGEVFITGGKSGERVEAIARDGAVLLSLALQHGVPLAELAKAITRDSQGDASSIVGAVIDRLIENEKASA